MDTPGTQKNRQGLIYAAAMLATVLWASSFPGTRYVLQHYSPVAIMLMRFASASVTLILFGVARNVIISFASKRNRRHSNAASDEQAGQLPAGGVKLSAWAAKRPMGLPKAKDLPLFLASGLSGVLLYSYFFNTGSVTVEAGISSFIIAASPVFTLLLARVFLKEKMKPIGWIGVGVSLAGLALVTLTQTADFSFNAGIFLMMIASLCSGVYSYVVRKLTKTYTALETTVYTMVIGTAGMFAFLPDVIREVPLSGWYVNLVVVFLGVFPAGIAYLAWGYALSKAEKTAHVTVFSYLIPFVSALLGFVWLQETLTAYALSGGVTIIAGMAMTNFSGKK